MNWPIYQPLGDQGILISFENEISPETSAATRHFALSIEKSSLPWVQEVLFSYRCIAVMCDLASIRFSTAVQRLRALENASPAQDPEIPELYDIPTVYGGMYGPDLDLVARVAGYSEAEVVRKFSSTVFTIYFLGFLCAQPYLGGLPEDLVVPRRESPRIHVPAGSVGIGGFQASLLTIDQPSGHNFIGRTSVQLYDPERIPPPQLKAGVQVRFPSISEDGNSASALEPILVRRSGS